jgi:hypothetical protein
VCNTTPLTEYRNVLFDLVTKDISGQVLGADLVTEDLLRQVLGAAIFTFFFLGIQRYLLV